MRALIVCATLLACRTGVSAGTVCEDPTGAQKATTDPAAAALAYAAALEAGKVDAAYALTDGAIPLEEFRNSYATPAARSERAKAVRAAAASLRVENDGVALTDRQGWRVSEPRVSSAAQSLDAFLTAAEKGDFKSAYALLAASWRTQYTPEKLQHDFTSEPLAKDRLARARAALQNAPLNKGDAVEFPIGEGKAVRLVREGAAFRVAALE